MANPIPSNPPVRSRALIAVLCLIGVGLLVNGAVLLLGRNSGFPSEIPFAQPAYAQNVGAGAMLGARGIYMMPSQLGPNTWGVYLMDLDSSTIVVYRADPSTSRFRLMAARSFKYDRFLEDFNNDAPTPKEIKKLVEQQRQRRELAEPETQDKKE